MQSVWFSTFWDMHQNTPLQTTIHISIYRYGIFFLMLLKYKYTSTYCLRWNQRSYSCLSRKQTHTQRNCRNPNSTTISPPLPSFPNLIILHSKTTFNSFNQVIVNKTQDFNSKSMPIARPTTKSNKYPTHHSNLPSICRLFCLS